jgi:hypothetical protein
VWRNDVEKLTAPGTGDLSMVPLKWGDVLSTLLPGALALFSLSAWLPSLRDRIRCLEHVGIAEGVALLIAAALVGGLLEAWTRTTWERFLVWRRHPEDVLTKLNATNIELYERGVQSSYKYVTFYANFAWATILLLVSRLHSGHRAYSLTTVGLLAVIAVLLRASYVQWTYYVNYQTKVIGGKSTNVEK